MAATEPTDSGELKASPESILRVWAVALAEREGVDNSDLRRLALGENLGPWRSRAAERIADPGDDPLQWLVQPLSGR
ncbi:hypothetical protein EON81_03325 [bacterium]|nr:MAG: hypothetical protein EON81_03325 [bacterium]